MRIERHPYLNIWVREDGCVYLPQSGTQKAKWTFGCKDSQGYRRVCIDYKRYFVHRLAAETFLQYPIPEGYEIDHISRVRHDNRLENIRIVSRSTNRRNCADHDRVEEQGRTHFYEDARQANRECQSLYRTTNRDKIARRNVCYRQTHRVVRFSDGSKHWVLPEEAEAYLKIPLKQRIFSK